MNIKPGKWRMRNGECAVVEFRASANCRCPWVGYDEKTRCLLTWSDGGLEASSDVGSVYDLIEPWTDKPVVNWSAMPAWAKWVAQDSNGAWYWYTSKPAPNNFGISGAGEWQNVRGNDETGLVFKPFIPSFDGHWIQSLAERPNE